MGWLGMNGRSNILFRSLVLNIDSYDMLKTRRIHWNLCGS